MSATSGYLAVQPRPAASLRLFCFHHAGAGASCYARWGQRLGLDVSVVPVRLPGREVRLREPRHTSGERLLRDLEQHLGPLLDEPYAFYGHSLGALVAYSFALRHAGNGGRAPELVAVGACSAPHLGMPLLEDSEMSDAELLAVLHETGGIAEQMLQRPAWLQLTIDIMRDDLLLARSLRAAAGEQLPCPLLAVAGRDDLLVSPDAVRAWNSYTRAGFRMRTLDGDHLFVRQTAVTELLGAALVEELPLAPAP
ncbi:thioesterase [Streptacidiphilus sp. PB12-B1b]|uniref:thioesterase II family protein n=1 Tax=Streptacidiphilus sp. PB12-B1b TaxID=2705012 RepID=UPI0015FD4073|nr:thioesterase [Streptacidiphilus sp. PB12-B1b]QMU78188.1 thioesterase [Streptacidiphilus sp. PB12-B1b]